MQRTDSEPECGVFIDETGEEALHRRPRFQIAPDDKGKGAMEEIDLESSDNDEDMTTRLARISRNHVRVQEMNGNRQVGLPPVISVRGVGSLNVPVAAVEPENLQVDEPVIIPTLTHAADQAACMVQKKR